MKTMVRVVFWVALLTVFFFVVFPSPSLKLIYAGYPLFQDRFGKTTAKLYEYDVTTGTKKLLYEGTDIAQSYFISYDEEKGKVYLGRTYALDLKVDVWNLQTRRYDGAIKMLDLNTKKVKTLKRFGIDSKTFSGSYGSPMLFEHTLYLTKFANGHVSLVRLDDNRQETLVADFPSELKDIGVVFPIGRGDFLFMGVAKSLGKKWMHHATVGRIKNGKIKIFMDKPDAFVFKIMGMDSREAHSYFWGIFFPKKRKDTKSRRASDIYAYDWKNDKVKIIYSLPLNSPLSPLLYHARDKTFICENYKTHSIDFFDTRKGKVTWKFSLSQLEENNIYIYNYNASETGSSKRAMLLRGQCPVGVHNCEALCPPGISGCEDLYLFDAEKRTLTTLESKMKQKWNGFGFGGVLFAAWNETGDKVVYVVED